MQSTTLFTSKQRPLFGPWKEFILQQNVNSTEIIGEVNDELYKGLKSAYTVWPDSPQEIRLFGRSPSGRLVIYSGLTHHLIKFLNKRGFEVQLVDKRPDVGMVDDDIERSLDRIRARLKETCGYELYAHQEKAIRAGLANPYGAFQIATGGGKTLIIAALIYAWNLKTMVLVDSIELMTQGFKELALMIPEEKLGKFGAGVKKPADVTVGIVDSLVNNRKVIKDCQYIVVDEAHMAAAKTFRQTITAASPVCRHGFTATYTRTMKSEVKVLYAVTGAKLMSVSASQLIQDGVIARPHITMFDLRGLQKRRKELVSHRLISKYIVNNILRNYVACDNIAWHYRKNRTVLVSVTRVKHGELLKSMLVDHFGVNHNHVAFVKGMQGGKGKTIRQAAIDNLEDGTCPILIATKIFEKGINIPSVDVGVNMKGEYSDTGCKQTIGRIIRKKGPGKDNICWFTDFYDSICGSLLAHSLRRLRNYNMEEEFRVRVVKPRIDRELIKAISDD